MKKYILLEKKGFQDYFKINFPKHKGVVGDKPKGKKRYIKPKTKEEAIECAKRIIDCCDKFGKVESI